MTRPTENETDAGTRPGGAGGQTAARPKKRRWRAVSLALKALAPVAVLALGAASYAGLKASKPSLPERPAQIKIWPVEAAPVAFANFRPKLKLYGEITTGRRVELRALVAGKVVETGDGMRAGGLVEKGDFLLKIDPFEYEAALEQARAKVVEARARYREIEAIIESEKDLLARAKEQLVISKRDLERALPLAERGTVSRKVVDDRRIIVSEREQAVELRVNNLAIQQARADQQRAAISQLNWQRRQAERNLEDTRLTAPFDAYVRDVRAERGRLIGVNDQVATLLDRKWIEARFTLSDRQFGRIVAEEGTVVGREIDVRWHVGDRPLRYSARIERVAAEISPQSGGVEVYARLADPMTPIAIRAGAFVEIILPDRHYENVARLPQTALYGGDNVYVIADGRLAARRIELVGAAGADVLVRGAINEGERVLTTRLSTAREGLRVKEQ